MNWNDVLIQVVNTAFRLVITLGIPYLFAMIGKHVRNDHTAKLMATAERLIVQSVEMVNQTFVNTLKEAGKFDTAAQIEAFKLCRENWLEMISEEMRDVVIEEVGDIESWLNTKIEATIAESKK